MKNNGRFVNFLMALCLLLISGFGAVNLFMIKQVQDKIDRVTALFLHERNKIDNRMDNIHKDLTDQCKRLDYLEFLKREKKQ
jgi:Skp family chaperone for outer membrane proteins